MGRIYISDLLILYFHSKYFIYPFICQLEMVFYQNNLVQPFYFLQTFLELLFMFLLGFILSLEINNLYFYIE